MKTCFQIILFFFCTSFAIAQGIDVNRWTMYEGTVGTSEMQLSLNRPGNDSIIQLSLYRFVNDSVKGSYCYNKYDQKILLEGKINGNEITLTEFINGAPNGYFNGRLITETYDFFMGEFTDAAHLNPVPFKLLLDAVSAGSSYEGRYADIHNGDLTDDMVEAFMKKVKTSVLDGDKEWLATHIRYPLTTSIKGKKKKIRNQKELIKNFSVIFHKQFRDAVKASCACNMFCNYHGAMLGNGKIWILGTPIENDTKTRLEIIAINN